MKRGMTLVEVTVAMAIFVTIVTIVVGAFVTVTRMKGLTSAIRESQQKVRVAMEMVTRLSRQAENVQVTPTVLTLSFNVYDGKSDNDWKTEFSIKNNSLFTRDWDPTTGNWTSETDLLGGSTELLTGATSSRFAKRGGIPPILEVVIQGRITNVTDNPYYSNKFSLDNSIILENVR